MIVKNYDELKCDPKGRFLIPEKERVFLGEEIIIVSGKDCLLFFTQGEWNQIVEVLEEKFSELKGRELRKMRRILFSSAFLQTIDSQGRVLIPVQLRGGENDNFRS